MDLVRFLGCEGSVPRLYGGSLHDFTRCAQWACNQSSLYIAQWFDGGSYECILFKTPTDANFMAADKTTLC